MSEMKMSKTRIEVFKKYNGRCAFCGNNLIKGWHVWDVDPIKKAVNEDGRLITINSEVENLRPACKPCGSVRIKNSGNKMSIESFRKELLHGFDFLKNGGFSEGYYSRALRFGLIIETGNELKFYFETINHENKT